MNGVNAAMKSVFDVMWAPFAGLPPWIGLLVLGVAFGVLALIAMKYTTNQKRVGRFKSRYQGHILAIKLFRDSFSVVITSLVKTLGWIGAYLGEQFKPMIVMMIPFVLLFAQMQMRLGYRPLDAGVPVLVTVDLEEGRPLADLKVELPAGVEMTAKPVREPSRHRVVVPVVARTAGAHTLRFTLGPETVEKTLHAGDLPGTPMVSPVRASGFWDQVLYPSEPAFAADSAFERIEVKYPVREIPLLGFDLAFGNEIGMAITFVLITIVAAFGLKGVFGVTI